MTTYFFSSVVTTTKTDLLLSVLEVELAKKSTVGLRAVVSAQSNNQLSCFSRGRESLKVSRKSVTGPPLLKKREKTFLLPFLLLPLSQRKKKKMIVLAFRRQKQVCCSGEKKTEAIFLRPPSSSYLNLAKLFIL